MTRKYVHIRVPIKAYENLVNKQTKMEQTVRQIVNRPVSVPLTKVLLAITENPINLPDNYLVSLTKRRRK